MAQKLTVRVGGKQRTMTRNKVVLAPSGSPKKKMVAVVNPRTGKPQVVQFGAKGYSIAPGTKKGDNYCTRSGGIGGKNDITSANYWARKDWNCSGRSSGSSRQSQLKKKK